MANKHPGRQTTEWLAGWNALDTLEAFWRGQGDPGREAAVDLVLTLRALMTAWLEEPQVWTVPAVVKSRARRGPGTTPRSDAEPPFPTGLTYMPGEVPAVLRSAYVVIGAGIQELQTALQASYRHTTQAESFRDYLVCLQETLVDLAAALGEPPAP